MCNVKINDMTSKLIRKQLCNAIRCPHDMLCNNATDSITKKRIRNQFCNVKNNYIIGEVIRMTKRWLGLRRVGFDDRNRHNRRNRQNRHGRLLALYFVGQAKGGQGALQNRQNCQHRPNHHEGYSPQTQPPFFCHPELSLK